MTVYCDRCSESSKNLADYENGEGIFSSVVLCHACAKEVNDKEEES